jgi:putative phosphoserine phosphatase/1-acylglycerol-3-phosphate O-acyltransferase
VSRHPHLRRDVEHSPRGPHVAAFFDMDGTLLAGFSVLAFWRDQLLSGRMGLGDLWDTATSAASFQRGRVGFGAMLTAMAAMLRGTEEKEYEQTGERLFEDALAALVYPEARELVEAHRERGHTLAIVSAATRYQADPLARDLGIEHVLCSQLEVENGRFTGRAGEACWAGGKATAARGLAEAHGIELDESYFYTDNIADLPLMLEVGRPRAVNPDRRLGSSARSRGWPVLEFESRSLPSALDVVRTGLSLGAMSTVLSLGLPAALLNRDRQRLLNACLSLSGELGRTLAGVQLRVEGEEHLWSQRPAIFLYNRQSSIDPILVAAMLRREFAPVARDALRRLPLLGRLVEATGTVFVGPDIHERGRKPLEPAIEVLRSGTSLMIAPEGSRSPTPMLRPFKRGAFRLALESGVPIVPIVLRNSLDALPRHSLIARRTTVEAVVHTPIPTHDWSRDSLAKQIARVRRLYLETLNPS